jgi:hypothetical protein
MSNKRSKIALFIFITWLSFACAGRIFEKTHIFSNPIRPIDEIYDFYTDTILSDDVWIFKPDGLFKARVFTGTELVNLSGKYSGDDVGDGFVILIYLNDDEEYTYEVYLDVENDAYSYIDWIIDDNTIKKILVS